jgi:hypothetical protein
VAIRPAIISEAFRFGVDVARWLPPGMTQKVNARQAQCAVRGAGTMARASQSSNRSSDGPSKKDFWAEYGAKSADFGPRSAPVFATVASRQLTYTNVHGHLTFGLQIKPQSTVAKSSTRVLAFQH